MRIANGRGTSTGLPMTWVGMVKRAKVSCESGNHRKISMSFVLEFELCLVEVLMNSQFLS